MKAMPGQVWRNIYSDAPCSVLSKRDAKEFNKERFLIRAYGWRPVFKWHNKNSERHIMIDAEESKNIYAEIGEAFCKAVTNWESINHTIVFPNEVPVMLKKIIALECKMALDPAISASANLLYQKGFSDGIKSIEGVQVSMSEPTPETPYVLGPGREITGPNGSFFIKAKEHWTGSWGDLDNLAKKITKLLNSN